MILYLIIGVVFLYLGAEALVKGAHRTSIRLGMTPLVAGLTVVSLATSTPEAVSSLVAQLQGHYGSIAIGNVVGSNICNIGLVLGITALVRPLTITHFIRWREIPIALVATAVLLLVMWLQPIGRWTGLILAILLIGYLIFQSIVGKKEHVDVEDPPHFKRGLWPICFDTVLILGGLAALVFGGYSFIEGAVRVATRFGVSQRVVGLTIVAIGSSLPELASSIIATLRGHDEMAIGNVVGSNVFNALFIVGLVSLVSPISFSPKLLHFDGLIMLGMSLLLWAVSFRPRITRVMGGGLLVLYTAYLVSLI